MNVSFAAQPATPRQTTMADPSANKPALRAASPAPRPFNGALRPERFAGETAFSYTRRMQGRLTMSEPYLRSVARHRGLTPAAYMEAKGGVPANTLVLDVGIVDELSGRRFLCPECTDGELVEVAPHIAYYCCGTHRLWAGPTLQAEHLTPVSIGQDVLAAEAKFRNLTADGRVTAGVLTQAAWAACVPGAPARRAARITPSTYPDIVALLGMLTDATFLKTWTDLADSRLHRNAYVRHEVEHRIGARAAQVASRVVAVMTQGESFTRTYVARGIPAPMSPLAVFDEMIAAVPGMPVLLRGASVEPDRTIGTAIATTSGPPRTASLHVPARHRSSVQRWTRDGAAREPVRSEEFLADGSFAVVNPDLVDEWHTERNGDRTPSQVSAASRYAYWWTCRVCGYECYQPTGVRSRRQRCPACMLHTAGPSTSLAALDPALAAEWDDEANGDLTPSDVSVHDGRLAAWRCPRAHQYIAEIGHRTRDGMGCPFCTNHLVLPGFNDLATTRPDLAAEWDDNRNGLLTTRDVFAGTNQPVHWRCGAHGHRWHISPNQRTSDATGCPVCTNRAVVAGENDLATTHPDVAKYWAPTLGEPRPQDVTAGSGAVLHWQCTNGWPHTFTRSVGHRVQNDTCPICRRRRLLSGFNDVATLHPAIARDWATDLNGIGPDQTLARGVKWWWRCGRRHLVHATVGCRVQTRGCPRCPPRARAGNADTTTNS